VSVQATDPAVSLRKFEREIAEFRAMADEYRRRGWFLVEADYPRALVVFASPKLAPAALVVGALFDYTGYDAVPPSVKLVNPFSAEPYKSKELPTALNKRLPAQEVAIPGLPFENKMRLERMQAYMQSYGPEEIPFLCLAGVREYHEHPAHSGDVWELHRYSGAGRLVRILEIIARYGVEPIVGYGVQFVPQISFNFGQPPE
jgi:hypothetical protein